MDPPELYNTAGSESDTESLESILEMKGYRIVDCETLGRVVSEACVCCLYLPACCHGVLSSKEGVGANHDDLLQ